LPEKYLHTELLTKQNKKIFLARFQPVLFVGFCLTKILAFLVAVSLNKKITFIADVNAAVFVAI
jgi:hypothetical protein